MTERRLGNRRKVRKEEECPIKENTVERMPKRDCPKASNAARGQKTGCMKAGLDKVRNYQRGIQRRNWDESIKDDFL